jgi:hypothetical protein
MRFEVRRNDALLRANCAPRRHLDSSVFLLSPKDPSTSSACRDTNAIQYMANIKASSSFPTFGRFPVASNICCWTVGACTILIKGLTFSRNVCHSLNICKGFGCSSVSLSRDTSPMSIIGSLISSSWDKPSLRSSDVLSNTSAALGSYTQTSKR